MSHFFVHSEEGGWAIFPLVSGHHVLSANPHDTVRTLDASHPEKIGVLVGRYKNPSGGENWLLKCATTAQVRLNGSPVYLGVHTLIDHDEIVLDGKARFFFSSEELVQVVPFPGAAQPVFCARDKSEIVKGSLAVRCPTCGTWCHQSEDKPCWLYGPTCPVDDHPTALDAGYRWTPETL